MPGPDPVALGADRHVSLQPDRHVRAARVGGVAVVAYRPLRRDAPVVEGRLAGQLHLDLPLQAHRNAHEQVFGVFVGRRPGVRRDPVHAAAGAEDQRVAHDRPPARGLPRGQQDVRPGLVDACRRDVDPERPEAEVAGLAVEQRAEHARSVEARDAEPVDAPVRSDQRAGVAVRQERVVGDRRERRGHRRALRHRFIPTGSGARPVFA